MTVSDLLREVENRGVALARVGNQLRFRPASALTPELVEGLRQYKTEILERLGTVVPTTPASPEIRDTAEVLELVRAHFGEIAPEHKMDAPYPPPEGNGDPLCIVTPLRRNSSGASAGEIGSGASARGYRRGFA